MMSSGATTPCSRLANVSKQRPPGLGRVVVGLVEDQQNRLVAAGQLHQGRVFELIEIGIGDEQDQIGPGGGVASHFARVGPLDFVDAGRVDQHDLRVGQSRASR